MPRRDGAGSDHLAVPGDRVVVGQGEGPDARVVGRGDEVGRLEDAVGAGRVRVQVDR